MNEPKFTELMKVLFTAPGCSGDGYVIGSMWKDGRWLYKLSCADPDTLGASFDSWFPEEWLTQDGGRASDRPDT